MRSRPWLPRRCWRHARRAGPDCAAMSRPERPDVVVIGAGAIGAAGAYELACGGARVTVIERGEPGAEASGASAGLLSAFASEPTGALATLQQLSRDLYQPLAGILRNESGIDIQHE